MRQGRQDLCSLFEEQERGIIADDPFGDFNSRDDARHDGKTILHAEDAEFERETALDLEGFGIETVEEVGA